MAYNCDVSRSQYPGHNSPELGKTIYSSFHARSCDFEKLPSGEPQSSYARGYSSIVVKRTRYRKVPHLTSQAQGSPGMAERSLLGGHVIVQKLMRSSLVC